MVTTENQDTVTEKESFTDCENNAMLMDTNSQ